MFRHKDKPVNVAPGSNGLLYTSLLPTSCTVFLCLLYKAPTCFGHITWLSSGSYQFGRSVQRV